MNVDALTLIAKRQDKLEERVEDVEDKVEGITELRRSVDRLTTAVYAAVGMVVCGAVAIILFGPQPT